MLNKIYICHYTKLSERKPVLSEQLEKLNITVYTEWVEVYDKEDIDFKKLEESLPNINKPMKLNNIHNNRKLRQSEISLILKHNYIWNDMIKNNISDVIVLEDDALLDDDFIKKFNLYIQELPNDYDLLWIGSCCNLHSKNIEPNKHIYREDGSRCTHGYMISLKCAKKMIEHHLINNLPVDFMFNEAIIKYGFENYWLEPDLVTQNKKFNSSIQNG